jgi:hypothetical protein
MSGQAQQPGDFSAALSGVERPVERGGHRLQSIAIDLGRLQAKKNAAGAAGLPGEGGGA